MRRYAHIIKSAVSVRNISTLCVKLAKEAVFGEVMKRCTLGRTRKLPGLPHSELYNLKKTILQQFPRYRQCLHEFEGVWRKCWNSIEQALSVKGRDHLESVMVTDVDHVIMPSCSSILYNIYTQYKHVIHIHSMHDTI